MREVYLEVYRTEAEALAAALDGHGPGSALWIHTDDCRQSAPGDHDCSCTPMVVVGSGKA